MLAFHKGTIYTAFAMGQDILDEEATEEMEKVDAYLYSVCMVVLLPYDEE